MGPAAAALATAFVLAGCGGPAPRAALDPELASCVPATAQIVAGIRLDEFRSSAVYGRLPESARALADSMPGATDLLVVLSTDGLLVAARGDFRKPPAGARLLTPRLALSGSPGAVDAASEAYRAQPRAVPELITVAKPMADRFPVWLAARGSASLPLPGNLRNLENFLRSTLYTTAGLQPADPSTLDVTGTCRSPEAAQRLEETLRAFLSLSGAAGRRPALLDSLRYHTEGAALRISVTVPVSAFDSLWR